MAQYGQLGDLGLELLRRVGRQVARTQGFPPPDGHAAWTDEAVDELLFEMISRKGEKFLLNCFLKTVDDTSLEKMFFTSIRNFLIDQAKGTERGKLRRRIARRLREADRFRSVASTSPRWALASHPPGAAWHGELEELIRAAWEVRGVWITAWNTSGPTPRQTVHALMGVLTGVLEAAGGAVREEDLAKVLEARFDLLTPAQFTALYADDGALIDSVTDREQGDAPVAAETMAGEIWDEMSPQERSLLSLLEDDPAEVSVLLGVGRNQTSAIMDALREKLVRALTTNGGDPREVAAALLRRSGDPP
ncbi:hypothetical protein [Streptomyces fulvoviolaceus]|uniref:hypothetical protein n=1 Tax=Streptomyces fulvoviolaceus TaxID=285535 RepID=UPI001F2DF78C|nr:hypothetical protein [Streptomyces fulvoviolaceus]